MNGSKENGARSAHEQHRYSRGVINFNRDISAVFNSQLPPLELKKAVNRINSSGKDTVARLWSPQESVLFSGIALEDGIAFLSPNLKQLVAENLDTDKDPTNADYINFLLNPDKASDDNLVLMGEATIWLMQGDTVPVNKDYTVHVFRKKAEVFTDEAIKHISLEKDKTKAFKKYATLYTLMTQLQKSDTMPDYNAFNISNCLETIQYRWSKYAETGDVLGWNPNLQNEIQDIVDSTNRLPDAHKMADIIGRAMNVPEKYLAIMSQLVIRKATTT